MDKVTPNLYNRIVDFYGQDAIGGSEIKKFYIGLGNLINYNDWSTNPISTLEFSKIDNLVLLKVHTSKYFVVPDPNGCLITSDGKRWTKTEGLITPNIYLQFSYDFRDLPSKVTSISQLCVCTNVYNPDRKSILIPDVDFKQEYVGFLLIQNINTIYKNIGTREIINIVITVTDNEWHTTEGLNQTFDIIPNGRDKNYLYT